MRITLREIIKLDKKYKKWDEHRYVIVSPSSLKDDFLIEIILINKDGSYDSLKITANNKPPEEKQKWN